MKPYYQDSQTTLYCGDCFDLWDMLPELDLVLTDPPYMIGASSAGTRSGRRKVGSWGDLMNTAHWYSRWYEACWAHLKETGFMMSFGNWRSIPMMMKALNLAEIPADSLCVWDRDLPGTSGPRQFRASFEIIISSGKQSARIHDRSFRDVARCQWNAGNMTISGHPAEKPISLLKRVIEASTKPGDVVFDPFNGGGSVLVAARECGRRAIGIEIEEKWCAATVKRLEGVVPFVRYPSRPKGRQRKRAA